MLVKDIKLSDKDNDRLRIIVKKNREYQFEQISRTLDKKEIGFILAKQLSEEIGFDYKKAQFIIDPENSFRIASSDFAFILPKILTKRPGDYDIMRSKVENLKLISMLQTNADIEVDENDPYMLLLTENVDEMILDTLVYGSFGKKAVEMGFERFQAVITSDGFKREITFDLIGIAKDKKEQNEQLE